MHANSLALMKRLLETHAYLALGKCVIDVGSRDYNGTYRNLIQRTRFESYTGIDIVEGKNVDTVVSEDGPWAGIAPAEIRDLGAMPGTRQTAVAVDAKRCDAGQSRRVDHRDCPPGFGRFTENLSIAGEFFLTGWMRC